eukprot:CAMPEP_0179056128 /NCGR_PEP_ID=MMETSP0796-20121207/23651_1 /TAXON_ID=73915 /ORGANISM="Pyrodinium bahamense, Strain pbaha01" /LENGTH=418 /DNA_ID=CAMNT_0020752791 /DNA_START=38 /DNA_END=1294 /DNA_ORIENTATION=-
MHPPAGEVPPGPALAHALEEQRRQTSVLRRATAACREELEALRCCLSESGVLRPTTFLVQLQRRRFAAVRAAHPLAAEARWEDALGITDIALAVGLFGGTVAVRASVAVSRASEASLGKVWSEIRTRCPPSIYICGGHDGMQPLKYVERFSLRSRTWEVLPPMMQRRSGASAGVASGKLYVCGGFNGQATLSLVECFDPCNGDWVAVQRMSVARVDAAIGVTAGLLSVCGGLDDMGQPLSLVERFGPAVGTWEALPPMMERRCKAAAGVIRGRLYMCGGRDDAQGLRSVESLLLDAEVWEPAPPMPEQRAGSTAAVAMAKLYVCGGNVGRQPLHQVARFDPEADAWETAAPMSVGRRFAAAAGSPGAVGGSWFCVFGGYGGGQSLSSAEQFNVDTGSWVSMPPMRWPRDDAAAATALE